MRKSGILLLLSFAVVGSLSAIVSSGRLQIPMASSSKAPVAPGLQRLEDATRGGLLYVPKSYRPTEPLPLLILLHGREGDSWNWFGSYGKRAEGGRFIIVAPDSLRKTWGGVGGFAGDEAVISRALAIAFRKCAIDRNRIVVGGFSDGAAYALSLGVANGDQIKGAIAFSPGYFIPGQRRGNPSFFVSHGVSDPMLPLDQTSRVFVSILRKEGYSVDYHEFYGKHEVPSAVSDQAMAWLKTVFSERGPLKH